MRALALAAVAAVAIAAVLLAACGGDDAPEHSGVPPATPIPALTDAERAALCDWAIAAQGGPHTEDCDGVPVTVQTTEECVSLFTGATCGRTVADIETCIVALDGDPCGLLDEPTCSVLAECGGPGDARLLLERAGLEPVPLE